MSGQEGSRSSRSSTPTSVSGKHGNDDAVSIDASVTEEDLVSISKDPRYRQLLTELLEVPQDNQSSTDNTSSDANVGNGTDTTIPPSDVVQPDQLATPPGSRQSNIVRRLLMEGVLGKRRSADLDPPPGSKRGNQSLEPHHSAQLFDPTLDREDKEDFRFTAPKQITEYLEKHFRRGLSKEERTAMLKRHPKPDTPVMTPPKLDQFITDFAPKNIDKARDTSLARILGSMLYAVNPLVNVWAGLIDQKLDDDPEALIPVSDVLEMIQRSIVLLGNTNNLISESRREAVLEKIQPTLRKYAKGDFSEAQNELFGMRFKENLVQKVEADTALSKAVRIVTRGSKIYQNPGPLQKQNRPLFQSRTSRYGSVFGKRQSPYQARHSHQYQGKGKYAPGKPHFKKGSVFERLSPQEKSEGNQ